MWDSIPMPPLKHGASGREHDLITELVDPNHGFPGYTMAVRALFGQREARLKSERFFQPVFLTELFSNLRSSPA
ncbi:hypothetical protein MHYP_G00166330 [Metynnis hypsauchen]